MLLGLFLRREWVTSIHSQRLFSYRRNTAAMMVLIVGVTFLVWDWRGMDRASVSGAARFGNWLFGLIMAAEAATRGAGHHDRDRLGAVFRPLSVTIMGGSRGGGLRRRRGRSGRGSGARPSG